MPNLIQNVNVIYDSVNALIVVAFYELCMYIYFIVVSVSCSTAKIMNKILNNYDMGKLISGQGKCANKGMVWQ